MRIRIPVGYEGFEEIRTQGSRYADKTEPLWGPLHRPNDKVTLFTRPRRFGKTLNMSMIESFLKIRKSSRGLFEGLSTARREEFCRT